MKSCMYCQVNLNINKLDHFKIKCCYKTVCNNCYDLSNMFCIYCDLKLTDKQYDMRNFYNFDKEKIIKSLSDIENLNKKDYIIQYKNFHKIERLIYNIKDDISQLENILI